jgi:hypothetical protein
MIRIEELDRDLLTLSQTQTEQGIGESVDPIIKFLVGEPLLLKDDGSPFWKFIGWKSQEFTYIHRVLLFSPGLLSVLSLNHSLSDVADER